MQAAHQTISSGPAAITYQAFPDACRLKNGDILCVFYAGTGHVTLPATGQRIGGRLCSVRSKDDGRSWSSPEVVYDGPLDDRDPHIAQLHDGRIIITFFSLAKGTQGRNYDGTGTWTVESDDNGITWGNAKSIVPDWYVSAPVRRLKNGWYILGIYSESQGVSHGGVVISRDSCRSWSDPIPIGKGQGIDLDAETDIIQCTDGTLWAALRSSKENMHFATSTDNGRTWSRAIDIGFKGHCPHINRLRSGAILMCHRLPKTEVSISYDECPTWNGPFRIADVIGAYPSSVELRDGSVLFVYYTEGVGSVIRAARFGVGRDGLKPMPLG